MAETKWAPGPWAVGTRYVDENDVFGADGFSVASVHLRQAKERCPDNVHPSRQGSKYRREISDEQWDANARLIAAAPDLYAALESAESVMTYGGFPDNPESVLAVARAALAKARGES